MFHFFHRRFWADPSPTKNICPSPLNQLPLKQYIKKKIIDPRDKDDFASGSHVLYCVLLPRVVRIETSFFFLAACLTALFQNSSQTGTTPRHLNTTFPVVFVSALHTAAPDHNISCRLWLCATHRGTWPQDFLSSLFMCYTQRHLTKTIPVVFVYALHTAAPNHKISWCLCLCATHRGTWPQHFLSSLIMCYTPRHLTTTFPVVFVYALHTAAPDHNIYCRLCLCATHRGTCPQHFLSSLFMRYTPRNMTTRFPVAFVCAIQTAEHDHKISCRRCLCDTHQRTWQHNFLSSLFMNTTAPNHKISCRLCLCDTNRGTWQQDFLSSLFMRYTLPHLTTTFPAVFFCELHTAAPDHNTSCRLCLCGTHRGTWPHNISCRLCLCATHRGTWPQHFLSSLFMCYTPQHLTTQHFLSSLFQWNTPRNMTTGIHVVFVYALHTAAPDHKISCCLVYVLHTVAPDHKICLSSLFVRYTRRQLASRFPVVFVYALAIVSIGGSSHSSKEHGNASALLYQYVYSTVYFLSWNIR